MLNTKNKTSKVIGISSFIAIWSLGSFTAIAQTPEVTKSNESKTAEVHGLPSNREAGGSRGNCDITAQSNLDDPIALIPDSSVNITASISPKLFFYVPETKEQKTIEFVLRDQNDQLVHEVFLQKTSQGGIMNVEIPQDVSKSLGQSDSNYHWYLSLICDNQKRARDLVLEGWISYVELDNSVKQKLEASTSAEQADFYQKEGIWYDALSVVAEDTTQFANPTATEQWSQMLESIGLEKLSTQPFIDGEIIK